MARRSWWSAPYLVGHYATREVDGSFDWELASIFGTAAGTTGLAIATGALAYATSGDLRATWLLADLTQKDQAARDRPLLIVLGWESIFPDGGIAEGVSGHLPIELRNIGLGPITRAVIEGRFADDSAAAEVTPAQIVGVMPGEEVKVTLVVTFAGETPEQAQYGRFEFRGSYFDRLGNEYELEFGVSMHDSPETMSAGRKWTPDDVPFIAVIERE